MKSIRKTFARKSEPASVLENVVPTNPVSSHDVDDLIEEEEGTSVSRAISELNSAVSKFKEHYMQFAKKNSRFLRVDHDVHQAIEKAGGERDIKSSAAIFGKEISATLRATEKKRDLSNSKWVGKLGSFITKLYPVARLSLALAGAAADVPPSQILLT